MENMFGLEDMYSSRLPPISKIEKIFETMTEEQFIAYAESVVKHNDGRTIDNFIYYLRLFRNQKNIQQYLNSPRVPIEIVEMYVIYSYEYLTLYYEEMTIEKTYDDILHFLSQERIMQLLVETEFVSHDTRFSLFVLTKLDGANIDRYFKETKVLNELLEKFVMLPEHVLNDIIFRNPFLFEYISSLLPVFLKNISAEEFSARFDETFSRMKYIKSLIHQYNGQIEKKRDWRDIDCLSLLVSIIRKTQESGISLSSYSDMMLSSSGTEIQIAHEIISNPMYLAILGKIADCSSLQSSEYVLF